ncbi:MULTISPECIES: hypothetical protein [Brucella/Ochrobactrum group]|uniref:Uncharacterized protein n=2 Tax=Brucella/Ochrobactrum group TaxID=2826938 RepID=A0A502BJV0_9HYPH|nr:MULTISPECIES: hypothetical protein [Brucella/Ochrobactrum group]MCX2699374.1 hypothetical protein [Ochrobactrum chromiisoli]TPF73951.1 hypothetical protein FHY56_17095 [Brucella gallinifaecis]
MKSPKSAGDYPGRQRDCKDAVSPGILNLLKQATLIGRSEEEADAVILGTSVPGVRDLINEAINAGWAPTEAATAIKLVSDELRRGFVGKELKN